LAEVALSGTLLMQSHAIPAGTTCLEGEVPSPYMACET
jgi:hypothetical protein